MDGHSELTGEKIRNVELSRTYFGGVDESATRELLANVAERLDESVLEVLRVKSERDELTQRVKELEAALADRVVDVGPQGYTEQALSQLIQDARQRFDDVLREANDEAALVKGAAEKEAEQLLLDASVNLRETQDSADELRTLVVDTSNRLLEALENARRIVEALEVGPPRAPGDTLVADLWPNADGNTGEAESSDTPGDELEQPDAEVHSH